MKEYDYAVEYSKTFINLSSILLGLTLTFSANITANKSVIIVAMLLAWCCWVSSIYFGGRSIAQIAVLVAGLGTSPNSDDEEEDDVDDQSIFNEALQRKLKFQRFLFIAGFVIAVISAFVSQWPVLG